MNDAANKVASVTFAFWIMKICATTVGETGGDLLSMTLNVGYAVSSLILIGFFLVTLAAQLRSRAYHPFLYWAVILSTSTAGTTMSDFMDRTLHLGYATGSAILVTISDLGSRRVALQHGFPVRRSHQQAEGRSLLLDGDSGLEHFGNGARRFYGG